MMLYIVEFVLFCVVFGAQFLSCLRSNVVFAKFFLSVCTTKQMSDLTSCNMVFVLQVDVLLESVSVKAVVRALNTSREDCIT